MRKVGVAAFIGALVEWYDYFLYGLAAGVCFNQLFFPPENVGRARRGRRPSEP
jgi:MFS transporter, MHS family, shikimate and dehydroshikimate transport protein